MSGNRNSGGVAFSNNFEPQIGGPFDARAVVPTKADLYLPATWTAIDGGNYVYSGMTVTIWDDSSNNGSYILLDAPNYTQVASWLFVGTPDLSGYSLTSSLNITNWNTAFGWGDHSAGGYLTSYTETDPIFLASQASNIDAGDITNLNNLSGTNTGDQDLSGYSLTSSLNISNWNTAHGWGDHSAVGYKTVNLFDNNGTVAAGRVVTVTDDLTFAEGEVNFFGSDDSNSTRSIYCKNGSGNRLFEVANGGVVKLLFDKLTFTHSGDNVYIQNQKSTGDLIFRGSNGGFTFMTMDGTTQSVGIGTGSPSAKLQVNAAGTTAATFGLKIHNSTGTSKTLVVRDDVKVGVGVDFGSILATLHVQGQEPYDSEEEEVLLRVDNGYNHSSINPRLTINSGGDFNSSGKTTVGTISGSFIASHNSFRLTQFSTTGTSPSAQGYQAFFSKSYGNSGNRTNSNGIGCDDLNASWDSYAKLNIGATEFSSGHIGLNVFDNVNHDYEGVGSTTTTLAKFKKTVGNVHNGGSGVSYLVGLDVDIQARGDVNYAALFNGGNVGIGTSTPHASAITQMSSTTQGFLKPVMTTTQRDAIATPAAGLEIFNTTTGKMNFFDGDAWKVITSS